MHEHLVEVDNVSMRFNLAREKVDSLKEYVVKLVKRQLYFEEFWALAEVSFTLDRGEVMGVIGPNGAGKSTLMRLVAGVLQPTLGSVKVSGAVAPLLELGTGFDYDLTGNENIYLNGAVLGHSTDFMRERHKDILDFAELSEFADVPLKNYSSGMCARLGFAIATMVQPDLLIADEILGVGDANFQAKCEKRIKDMIRTGTSVILVSHSAVQVASMCSKALLLHKGRMVQYGRVAGQ